MPRSRGARGSASTPADRLVEAEMITRQISWLRVYANELKVLEQPNMPAEKHSEIMTLRAYAPGFFGLIVGLLRDALILGLDNVLDKPGTKLTLQYVVEAIADPTRKAACEEKLAAIRRHPTCRLIDIARNHLIAHPNYDTLMRYDQLSAAGVDPVTKIDYRTLTISALDELLREVVDLAALALEKLPSDFLLPHWKGAWELFEHLRAQTNLTDRG